MIWEKVRSAFGTGFLASAVFLFGLFGMISVFDIATSLPHPIGNLPVSWVMIPLEAYTNYFAVGFILLGCLSMAIALSKWKLVAPLLTCFLFGLWISFFYFTPSVRAVVDFNSVWFNGSWLTSSTPGLVEDKEAFFFFLGGVASFLISQMLLRKGLKKSLLNTVILGSGVVGIFTGAITLLTNYGPVFVTSFQRNFFNTGFNLNFITNEIVFLVSITIITVYSLRGRIKGFYSLGRKGNP